MDAFSLTDLKKKNYSDIYHYIYSNPGCSRQAIATALSISLPTVSQHLLSLQNESLIETCGQLSSSMGRRATAYQIISTARIAVGIEILSRSICIVALNLYGKKEAKEKYRISFSPNQIYFENLQRIVKDFLQKYQIPEEQILGIGLGMQGLASPDGAQMTYGKILDCTGLSVELFSRYFSFPCKFIHDSECAADSELWENPEISDAIYISLGHHLGGAIIIGRELQNGLTGKSGTFEHMTLVPDGLTCYCGKKGCAECYCSGHFLMEPDMELEDFFEKKEQGDTACLQKWEDYLKYLSMLINNLHMVIENTVILGGRIAKYLTPEDIASIRQAVQNRSSFPDDVSYLLHGNCRSDAVSAGAALPFIRDFLNGLVS